MDSSGRGQVLPGLVTRLCYALQMATILFYLSDVEEGGDTIFPLEGRYGQERLKGTGFNYKSCEGGYRVSHESRLPLVIICSCNCVTGIALQCHGVPCATFPQKSKDLTLSLSLSILVRCSTSREEGMPSCSTPCTQMGHLTSTRCMEAAQSSRERSGWRQSGSGTSAFHRPACDNLVRLDVAVRPSLAHDTC